MRRLAADASGAAADEEGPAAATLTVDVNPLEMLLDGPVARPAAAPTAPRRRKAVLLGLGAIGVLALAVGIPRLLPPGAPAPQATPGEGPAPTEAAVRPPASPTEAALEPKPAPLPLPAQVVVDFRHPLRSGTLRILMDGERVVGQSVAGDQSRNLLVSKLHSGVFTDLMEVEAGRHEFEVEVKWDDNTRRKRIPGIFRAGETYRLEIRLGRLRRNLSLKWTR
jgi:hypothetical protein